MTPIGSKGGCILGAKATHWGGAGNEPETNERGQIRHSSALYLGI